LEIGGTTAARRRRQRAIESRQLLDKLRSPQTSCGGSGISKRFELLNRPGNLRIESGGRRVGLSRHKTADRTVDVGCKAVARFRGCHSLLLAVVSRLRKMDSHSAAPLVERIEHIGFTKIDSDGPPAWALGVVTVEIPIDTMSDDLGWNASRGPARHKLESRADDANQVAVILPAEVRFDVAAVLIAIHEKVLRPA
jgi:hypothetical protein